MPKKNKRQRKDSLHSKHRRFVLSFIVIILFAVLGFMYHRNFQQKVGMIDSLNTQDIEKIELEKKILTMVRGYPIEEMVPFIMQQDEIVAIFLISIAKKESNWGKRIPVYLGKDCFNYWGYRGPNPIGSGKHSCFATRKEAIEIVGGRIEKLVKDYKRDTPEEMIVWKCGSSCATHDSFGVRKWISDVDLYFQKLSK